MEKEKKPIYKKWWFWVTIVLVVLIIGGASSNDSSNTVQTSSNESTQTQATETTQKQVNVGEAVQTNEVKITYVSCQEYTGYDSYSAPKDGNKVMKIEMEFENITDKDIYLENLDCYSDGQKCEAYYYADDYKSPTLESLSKGKKLKATLYYEIPKSSTENILEYETNYWTDKKIEFVIK